MHQAQVYIRLQHGCLKQDGSFEDHFPLGIFVCQILNLLQRFQDPRSGAGTSKLWGLELMVWGGRRCCGLLMTTWFGSTRRPLLLVSGDSFSRYLVQVQVFSTRWPLVPRSSGCLELQVERKDLKPNKVNHSYVYSMPLGQILVFLSVLPATNSCVLRGEGRFAVCGFVGFLGDEGWAHVADADH